MRARYPTLPVDALEAKLLELAAHVKIDGVLVDLSTARRMPPGSAPLYAAWDSTAWNDSVATDNATNVAAPTPSRRPSGPTSTTRSPRLYPNLETIILVGGDVARPLLPRGRYDAAPPRDRLPGRARHYRLHRQLHRAPGARPSPRSARTSTSPTAATAPRPPSRSPGAPLSWWLPDVAVGRLVETPRPDRRPHRHLRRAGRRDHRRRGHDVRLRLPHRRRRRLLRTLWSPALEPGSQNIVRLSEALSAWTDTQLKNRLFGLSGSAASKLVLRLRPRRPPGRGGRRRRRRRHPRHHRDELRHRRRSPARSSSGSAATPASRSSPTAARPTRPPPASSSTSPSSSRRSTSRSSSATAASAGASPTASASASSSSRLVADEIARAGQISRRRGASPRQAGVLPPAGPPRRLRPQGASRVDPLRHSELRGPGHEEASEADGSWYGPGANRRPAQSGSGAAHPRRALAGRTPPGARRTRIAGGAVVEVGARDLRGTVPPRAPGDGLQLPGLRLRCRTALERRLRPLRRLPRPRDRRERALHGRRRHPRRRTDEDRHLPHPRRPGHRQRGATPSSR